VEDLQRLALVTGPVEREHHLLAEAFPQRVLLDELPEVGKDGASFPEHDPRADEIFPQRQPRLLQPRRGAAAEQPVAGIQQRGPAPQLQGALEQLDRPPRASRESRLSLGGQPLEPDAVDPLRRHVKEVAIVHRAQQDSVSGPPRRIIEHFSHSCRSGLEGIAHFRRWPVRPQFVGECRA
jgi:hypothetical protein